MIVTVTCTTEQGRLSTSALDELDQALASLGLKREVRSAIVSGKSYTSSYEGAQIDRSTVEGKAAELASKYRFKITVDVEESVKFP